MMPSSDPSSRRRKRAQVIHRQLAELRDNLHQSLQANRRQQWLRRQRQQRQRVNADPDEQLMPPRWVLQFRWLMRRIARRRGDSDHPSWNPAAFLFPSTATPLSTIEAAALVLRHGAATLLLLILISWLLDLIPLQLGSPNWYLQVVGGIADNAPIFLLISGISLLSLALSSDSERNAVYRVSLLRFSRVGYQLALWLLPVQIGLTAWLFGQTWNINRIQLAAIRASGDALISGAQQTSTNKEFVVYLRSRNITANLESVAAAPLAQVRGEFIRSVKQQQQQQERELATNTRNTFLGYVKTSLKLFASLLIQAGFLRIFQSLVRRCAFNISANQGAIEIADEAGDSDAGIASQQ